MQSVAQESSDHASKLSELFATPAVDENGRTYRDRLLRRKFSLGLFLPNMSGAGGGYFPADMDSGTEPTFEYNAKCAELVDDLGFDFIFPPGRWKGNGGRTAFNDFNLEVVTLTSALAARTRQVFLFTTWHVSYHFHPMHVVKMGATIDHISGGRWGLNIVTGWKQDEIEMFGLPFLPREERYALADEFVLALKAIWGSDLPADLKGKYFQGKGCVALPRPVQRPWPLLINAGSSVEGIAFAARQCDLIFVTGGTSNTVNDLVPVIQRVRKQAADVGRTVKIFLPVTLICRDTEAEARDLRQEILDHADREAVENITGQMGKGTGSWSEINFAPIVLGSGGFGVFGTPEQATEVLNELSTAGIDGVQLEFWNYLEEIAYFGEHVLPLLEERGLRDFDHAEHA
jgi:dimethylsulfone monooxygenase